MATVTRIQSSRPQLQRGKRLSTPTMPLTPPPEDDTDNGVCLKIAPKTLPPAFSNSGLLTPPDEKIIEQSLFPSRGAGQFTHMPESAITVAVLGVGFVGEQLATAFSSAYNVIAFDVSEHRVSEVAAAFQHAPVQCTTDPRSLSRATHFLIAVPTPANDEQEIDTRYLRAATSIIAEYARPGSTVVMHSTVPVGMTRRILEPLARSKSLKCGMSPERLDPGRPWPRFENIPRLVSGLDFESMQSIHDLYSEVFRQVVPVSSTEVAEMTKLYEDCQRMMCIAFANEMADACRQLSQDLSNIRKDAPGNGCSQTVVNIDPFEVAKAAATKPFGFQPYTPSLGVGGDSMPASPSHLLLNADLPLLEACTTSMRERPAQTGDRVMASIQRSAKLRKRRNTAVRDSVTSTTTTKPRSTSNQPQVLVVGMGYKRGQSSTSNSSGLDLSEHLLESYKVSVEFADPLVPQEAIPSIPRLDETQDWNLSYLRKFDAIIIAIDQPGIELGVIDEAQRHGVLVESFGRTKSRWA